MAGFESLRHAYRLSVPATMFCFLFVGPVNARLPDVAPSFSVEHVTAIHRPTGCNATLEFSNKTLIGAFITDPLCLPQGVKARTIPAFLRDFHVPASKREIIRTR
jgi:hypothetical protein